jgi:pimeloyl-ACP methyl ester carboxylesterase
MSPQDQAELILKATRQLDIPSALWLGHSWAGSVVLAAARQNPVEMSGAILLAPMTHDWQTGVSWHVSLASAPVVGPVFSSTLVPIVGRVDMAGAIASVFEPEAVPTDYRANTAVELSLRPDHFRNNAADVARASDWLSINSRYYADIDIPVLSITGSADSVVPSWNHTERLSQQVKDLSWHVIEGAGHALHHTRIEEIGDLIDQFISDLNGTER